MEKIKIFILVLIPIIFFGQKYDGICQNVSKIGLPINPSCRYSVKLC